MMNTFIKHRYNAGLEESLNIGGLVSEGDLTNLEVLRLEKIKEAWNFYEGYHWEGIDDLDSPQVTFNYCRPFVNKFVSFECGKGFSIKTLLETRTMMVLLTQTNLRISRRRLLKKQSMTS